MYPVQPEAICKKVHVCQKNGKKIQMCYQSQKNMHWIGLPFFSLSHNARLFYITCYVACHEPNEWQRNKHN